MSEAYKSKKQKKKKIYKNKHCIVDKVVTHGGTD